MPREQPDFVVIANRLPVDRVTSPDGEVLWRTSPGGLVTALEPVMRRHDGAWIGWHGAADEKLRPFEHAGMHLVPIPLTEDDVQEYYEGFSNATLWPLYHDVIAAPEYHREWWDAYVRVNRRFAKKAAQIAAEGATVWVQDYQLQLVPQMLRALRPDLRIGFFLHIPFPPTELYQQLPWRREILEGLLGADLVGFQAPGAAQNFIRLVRQRVGHKTHRDTVYLPDGRTVLAKAYPISIDAEGFESLSRTPEVQARAAEIRESLDNPETVLLGIDRLDYTKGLPQRLRAFGELVADGLVRLEDVKFIQIATPSRERVNSYKLLRDNINQLVGRINGDIGRIGQQPIQYLHASYPREEMAAMYRAADVMVVTPLRDGMNLVAKEYVATRWDNRGALVLSEFAGAAAELKQAYLANPHDINGLKQKMLEAINASGRETSRRMKALRKQVMENDIDRWANDFLTELNAQRDPHGKTTRPVS
ncbi:trehalose-6-phosphate synthase [Aeromicrobium sp. PE09-221]|uniref:alpha,alpha-trehalose-phosphate synthase (UDP-forming) n=1 Tax=Aeromicrobium sp. PE09-221 TaxID=1898043 RepID=UPI000B3E97A3|nr:trehalose-6-phosphate synthase [Aeromicrobium sp. PE09-221]OUZ07796.1 trehalose-6-phosphate synthase [Aeromicrobium sp. PE09-221]